MEEGKGEAYASKIDVPCSDRNKIIAYKNVLIARGGSATTERCVIPTFGHWISRIWQLSWTKANSMARIRPKAELQVLPFVPVEDSLLAYQAL